MGYALNLNRKTGFTVTDVNQPIIINDYRGKLFYSTQPMIERGNKVFCFNLPKGKYFVVTGYFDARMYPVKYNIIPLPFPQRWLPKPTDFAVMFGYNPNKCTIFWDKKQILFDSSFKEKPLNEIFFILFHEYGHHLYQTEKYADVFSGNEMLKYGFNPTQIGSSPLASLSDRQIERKNFLISNLERHVFKRK